MIHSVPRTPSPPCDLVLSLETWPLATGPGRCLARMLSPAESVLGESVSFDLPLDAADLGRELERLEDEISLPLETRSLLSFQGPRELGRALFDSLFDGPLGRCFRAELKNRGAVRLGLLFDPDEPGGRELCALPWELLYDHRAPRPMFLGTSPATPIVRHLWTVERRGGASPDATEPCPVFSDPRRTRQRRSDGLDPDSEQAIAAVQAGAPAAIAFQFPVSEQALATFGHTVTQLQRDGRPIEQAVTRGRQAIESLRPGTWEWAAPVLYLGASAGRG